MLSLQPTNWQFRLWTRHKEKCSHREKKWNQDLEHLLWFVEMLTSFCFLTREKRPKKTQSADCGPLSQLSNDRRWRHNTQKKKKGFLILRRQNDLILSATTNFIYIFANYESSRVRILRAARSQLFIDFLASYDGGECNSLSLSL